MPGDPGLRCRSGATGIQKSGSAETFPVARPRYPFLEWFEGIVISGEIRMVKPDARVFGYLLDRYGLNPRTTVFIDDSKANVRAAKAIGMIGIKFDDPGALRRSLAGFGLLDGAVGGAGAT